MSSSTRRNLKEKYTKKSPANVLNSDNIKLIKYNDKDAKKLKDKYTVKTSAAHISFEKEFVESVRTNTETKMVKSPEVEDVVSPKVNVFQFMMNSRHKVIGSNSPGKEKKPEPEKSPEDIAEKKEKIKKRKAALGEWAEKKGGQKRKLADEAQEEHIKEKLKERAKRLKKMLDIIDEDLRNSSHDESDHEVQPVKADKEKTERENEINELNKNTEETPKRRISRRSKINGDSVKKNLSTENETPKNNNKNLEEEVANNQNENKESNVTKSTKSVKKSIASLSLKKNKKSTTPEAEKKTEPEQISESTKIHQLDNDTQDSFPSTPVTNKKHKQLKLFPDSISEKKDEENKAFTPRSWKMKVRLFEKENINKEVLDSESVIIIDDEESPKKNQIQGKISNFFGSPLNSSKCNESKKDVKLAPLFLKQQTKKQTKAELKAKRDFLFSGMPDQVKKATSRQQSMNDIDFDLFPKISHVQQRSSIDGTLHIFWDLPNTALSLIEKNLEFTTKIPFDPLTYGTLTNCDNNIETSKKHVYLPPTKLANLKECIITLKQQYPNYPVFKTFRLLYEKYMKHNNKIESTENDLTPKSDNGKKRRGRPKKSKSISKTETEIPVIQESQMWTEKYKPLCQDDIIGNYSAVKQLKSWLQSWVHYSENQKQMNKRKRANSSSDDFCNDSDTRDTAEILPQNMMILVGPLGTGKTASVYALCNELNINIIEINASSKRTGKRILTELQEATQSHQVKNTDSKSMNSFFQKKTNETKESKEAKEEESKKLSLLLMEDVDIVFDDQDDGFISSLTTLVISSKRPIILTTSDKNCLHLQKLLSQHDVIDFTPLSCRVASPWLQILSLIEGVRSDRVMIDRLLEWHKGDVRKTLLQLQFWVQSGGDSKLDNKPLRLTQSILDSQDEGFSINDDENSNLSWFECDSKTETSNQDIHRSCIECFTPFYERDKTNFQLEFPINLGNIWWNIPSILNFPFIGHKEIFKATENCNEKETENTIDIDCSLNATKCISETEISDISSNDKESVMLFSQNSDLLDWKTAINFLESLVFTDTMYAKLKRGGDFEPTCQFWQINPVNSLLLTENYEMYNETNNLSYEIAQWLIEQNIKECNKKLNNCEIDVNVALPNLEERRWRTKVHKTMESVTDIIPPSCLLDRAGICKDYFPFMRTICRVENIRFANNNKRKNRFYHYFKTFNIHLSDATHLILCNSLAIKNY